METITGAIATVKRSVTSRRRSESFDVSFTIYLLDIKLSHQVGEPMNTTKTLHVSPDMIGEDMKNWGPEQWTRHLQEQVNQPLVVGVYVMICYYRCLMKRKRETWRLQNLQI